MKVVTTLLSELQEQENTEFLSPQQLRLILLKTMNHLLLKYDANPSNPTLVNCIDELQRLYNYLQQSRMITREQLNEVKNEVYSCLNNISTELAELQ